MKHYTEEDLIAYQMGDASEAHAIRAHLEDCAACATLAESIAETLRVFSAEPVPMRSTAQMDASWQRLRGNLAVLEVPQKKRWFAVWMWPAAGVCTAALVVMVVLGLHIRKTDIPASGEPGPQQKASISDTLKSLVGRHNQAHPINGHGPLTDIPNDNPQITAHLDSAERLLTAVSHEDGPLDETTRSQAHDLLLKNAVYTQTARERGDLSEAAVLDNLGRVLIGLDHAPETPRSTWQLRLEMNTDGLLLDLRVLRQNDEHSRTRQ
ncbi:anti-sigma factor [Terriglobus tenax]|uniref:hypothetical protein n=1 Tax=Terriglobus tenax TaxID=1111115 RepID=UPI0021DFB7BD|nr:hypothetical protein [Terriglobus tenax]